MDEQEKDLGAPAAQRSALSCSRGFFGMGIYHAKTEHNIGTLWRSAHNFGAAFIFTVGRRYPFRGHFQAGDTTHAAKHVPLYHYADLGDLIDHLPRGCPLVGIELHSRAKPLPDFVHPERACYMLGAEDNGLPAVVVEQCHMLVEVPGAEHCLNVASAGSIVLYDRIAKGATSRVWRAA